MEYFDWVAIWRDFNIVLSVIAGFLLIRRGHKLRRWWTYQERNFIHAQFLFVMAALIASLEGVIQGNPFGVRVPMTTVALVMTIHAGLKPSERHQKEQRA